MLLALFLVLCIQASSNNIYVNQNSDGDGTSWDSAFGNLMDALSTAKAGDQIWVAKGTYSPSTTDRTASFSIPEGVKLYGGFAGNEESIDSRNLESNLTILSGEIGNSGPADNSYTVVYFENVTNSTVLDGFIIKSGNANSELEEGNPSRCGGGIYMNGEKGICNPEIYNCTLTGNLARDGAAVFINGRSGQSNPTFFNCTFSNNEAGLDGGAIYNDGRLNGNSNPVLNNCVFTRNMGTYGGAICNNNEKGACNLTLNSCEFLENAAYLRGGAIFSMNGSERCYLEMSDCQFENNFPDDQNMIFTSATGRSDAYKIAGSNP